MDEKKELTANELDQVVGGVGEEPGIMYTYRCTNQITETGICGKYFLSNSDFGACPECGCTDSSKRIRID